ncbi:hypothetical protein HDU67_009892 [Dinochytrium kinnereticum]|nr:hypothetical protein HDU67_009892 [Dinochytrium kinnereticum]
MSIHPGFIAFLVISIIALIGLFCWAYLYGKTPCQLEAEIMKQQPDIPDYLNVPGGAARVEPANPNSTNAQMVVTPPKTSDTTQLPAYPAHSHSVDMSAATEPTKKV